MGTIFRDQGTIVSIQHALPTNSIINSTNTMPEMQAVRKWQQISAKSIVSSTIESGIISLLLNSIRFYFATYVYFR